MHPQTHALLSWLLAEAGRLEQRRDRALVLAAGLAPDLDGLSILFGSSAYHTWHRVLCHHGLGAVTIALACAAAARQRARTGLLALAAAHLHFACDMVGSAGPDGSIWPVPYLVPFDMQHPGFAPPWQWQLASWQNVAITLLALAASAWLASRRGRTLLEALSLRVDAAVVDAIRRRLPPPGGSHAPSMPQAAAASPPKMETAEMNETGRCDPPGNV